jgi:hypothetical protein
MPRMGMSKKARNVASISNKTTTFGTMGGIAPRSRLAGNMAATRNKASNQQSIPLKPVPGLSYMKGNNPMGRIMLSSNPQCSGGVGRTAGGGFAGCGATTNVSNNLLLYVASPYGTWLITIGGGTVSQKGAYKYHTFTTTGTLTMTVTVVGGLTPTSAAPTTKAIEHLVVGGGGGGGNAGIAAASYGGGGAGGLAIETTGVVMTTGTQTATVGAGGTAGLIGSISTFLGVTGGAGSPGAAGAGAGAAGGGNGTYTGGAFGGGLAGGGAGGNSDGDDGNSTVGFGGKGGGSLASLATNWSPVSGITNVYYGYGGGGGPGGSGGAPPGTGGD